MEGGHEHVSDEVAQKPLTIARPMANQSYSKTNASVFGYVTVSHAFQHGFYFKINFA
jgi:hypothetical protein